MPLVLQLHSVLFTPSDWEHDVGEHFKLTEKTRRKRKKKLNIKATFLKGCGRVD